MRHLLLMKYFHSNQFSMQRSKMLDSASIILVIRAVTFMQESIVNKIDFFNYQKRLSHKSKMKFNNVIYLLKNLINLLLGCWFWFNQTVKNFKRSFNAIRNFNCIGYMNLFLR